MKKTSKRTAGSRKRSPRRRARARKQAHPEEQALAAFAAVAARAGVRWYLFGAGAVSLHGFPRATADLDITVDLGAVPVEVFIKALRKAGFDPRFDDDEFVRTTRVIPVVHRSSALPIDVVLAGPGLEQQFLDEVVEHRVGKHAIPVISIENLIVTKILAGRPKDLEDVRQLLEARGPSIDHEHVEGVLAALEEALGQSDLVPRYRTLRA